PKSGASAPGHFHFQAGNKGFLPIDSSPHWNNALRIESVDRKEMLDRFELIYNDLPIPLGEDEPKMNIITFYGNGLWTTFVFPRKKHRPACFSAEGEAQMIITPGAVDMGGVLIMPMEKDFNKITAGLIEGILNEVNEKKI
ncbi:MAG: DUF4922 domain-containing protein, partial [Tannerella sp.]|nr:DUF4922 domain-containing protein [Tannerella sp.]